MQLNFIYVTKEPLMLSTTIILIMLRNKISSKTCQFYSLTSKYSFPKQFVNALSPVVSLSFIFCTLIHVKRRKTQSRLWINIRIETVHFLIVEYFKTMENQPNSMYPSFQLCRSDCINSNSKFGVALKGKYGNRLVIYGGPNRYFRPRTTADVSFCCVSIR